MPLDRYDKMELDRLEKSLREMEQEGFPDDSLVRMREVIASRRGSSPGTPLPPESSTPHSAA